MKFESEIARAGFAALLLANTLACSPTRNPEGNLIVAPPTEVPVVKPEPSPRAPDPSLCQGNAELLRPAGLNAQAFATYRSGVLVNLGSGMKISYNHGLLDSFNSNPNIGIGLPAGVNNLTYLFPRSLKDPAVEQAKLAEMQLQISYPLYRLYQEQRVTVGKYIMEVISLADALIDAKQSGARPGTTEFYEQASINLSLSFARSSRKTYVSNYLNGSIDSSLPLAAEKEISRTTPILISSATSAYLSSIGIN